MFLVGECTVNDIESGSISFTFKVYSSSPYLNSYSPFLVMSSFCSSVYDFCCLITSLPLSELTSSVNIDWLTTKFPPDFSNKSSFIFTWKVVEYVP